MSYELRPYQVEGSEFLVHARRAILADDMGLGKTLTSLDATYQLSKSPTLILAPKIALYVWQKEIDKWFGEPSAVYSGFPHIRNQVWRNFEQHNIRYLITNYAFAQEVMQRRPKWDNLICDEIHIAGLLNRKTQTFGKVQDLARASDLLFLLTGTPMRQTPADLWAPLNLVAPKDFTSYWNYVRDYCITTKNYIGDKMFGITIERRPADIAQWQDMLKCYLIRRLKSTAMPDLPPKTRQPLYVDMTHAQATLYNQMAKDYVIQFERLYDPTRPESFGLGTDRLVVAQSEMVARMRLRQLLITPQILGLNIVGGLLKLLPEMINNEFLSGNPVVIFTPFKKAIPFIMEALQKLNPISFFVIHGGMSAKATSEQWKGFQDSTDLRRVFICTIKSGASFDLHSSAVAYFIGYEWDAHLNVQAEDRLHREGQIDNVRIHYLIHKNTVDEDIMRTVAEKQDAFDWTVRPTDYLSSVKITC